MPGGLDDFDVDEASQNLANVGQPDYLPGVTGPVTPPAPGVSGQVSQNSPTPDVPIVPAPAEIQQDASVPAGQPGNSGTAVPKLGPDDVAPMTPDAADAPQFEPLEAPPPRPALTGDPAKDLAATTQYDRDLTAWHTKAAAHQNALNTAIKGVQSKQADREAEIERQAAADRKAELERYAAERAKNQSAIDANVKEHADAAKDLEGAKWANQSTGAKIVSLIAIALGGRAAQFSNIARVQLHQAPDAQNEVLNAIDKQMQQDYQKRQDRLKAASDSLLQARYGFKDAADNHRAALNDLDAETSAKYKLAAKEAESRLRQFGATQADIDKNVLVAGLYEKANKAEAAIHEREEGFKIQREGQAAQREQAAATLKLAEANLGVRTTAERDAHLDRAAARADRRELAEERRADRAEAQHEKKQQTSVRQNAVLGNLAEAEKAASDIGPVSESAIRKLQTNEERSTAAKHSAESGIFGSIATAVGRGVGAIPRGRYEGIPDDEQKKITAAEQVITHLTEMQQGKNIETLEQYRERYSPYVPGLSIAEVRRREKALPGLVAEQRAVQDPNQEGARRSGRASEKAPAPQTKKVGNAVYEYVPDEVEAR